MFFAGLLTHIKIYLCVSYYLGGLESTDYSNSSPANQPNFSRYAATGSKLRNSSPAKDAFTPPHPSLSFCQYIARYA